MTAMLNLMLPKSCFQYYMSHSPCKIKVTVGTLILHGKLFYVIPILHEQYSNNSLKLGLHGSDITWQLELNLGNVYPILHT
jgi:hypothetical protein